MAKECKPDGLTIHLKGKFEYGDQSQGSPALLKKDKSGSSISKSDLDNAGLQKCVMDQTKEISNDSLGWKRLQICFVRIWTSHLSDQ